MHVDVNFFVTFSLPCIPPAYVPLFLHPSYILVSLSHFLRNVPPLNKFTVSLPVLQVPWDKALLAGPSLTTEAPAWLFPIHHDKPSWTCVTQAWNPQGGGECAQGELSTIERSCANYEKIPWSQGGTQAPRGGGTVCWLNFSPGLLGVAQPPSWTQKLWYKFWSAGSALPHPALTPSLTGVFLRAISWHFCDTFLPGSQQKL